MVWLIVCCSGLSSPYAASCQEPQLTDSYSGIRASQDRLRVDLLNSQIAESRRAIEQLDPRIDSLQQQLDTLLRQAASVQPRSDAPPADRDRSNPLQVRFRPPLAHLSRKPQTLYVICEENRLTVVDNSVLKPVPVEEIRPELERVAADGGTAEKIVLSESESFDRKVTIKKTPSGISSQVHLVRKAGSRGEEHTSLGDPESVIAARLAEADAETTRIVFIVYPDSYDAFRAIRSTAWSRSFDVNWLPFSPGEPMRLGAASRIAN